MADPTAADLLTPLGPIDPADCWPQLTLDKATKRVTAFLADGVSRATGITDAAKNWAFVLKWGEYRTWSEVYNRLTVNPSSVDVRDEGSSGMFVTQIQNVKDLRDEALAAAEGILAEETGTEDVALGKASSYNAEIGFRW